MAEVKEPVEEQKDETPPEAPEEEKPEGEEPSPEEASAEEGKGEEDGEESPPTEPKPEEKAKRAGGWQRRISQLERNNAALMEQLAARGGTPAPPGKEKTAEEKAAEYIENLVERRLADREARQNQTKAQVEFQRRTEEVRAANPDFDDVVLAVDTPVSAALQEALLTSEHGPAIMYSLAKSPAELARISALPPLAAAREVGRLEAKVASSTAGPKSPKSAVRPPVPPTKVGGSSTSTRNLDDLPLREYKRAMRSR